MATTIRASAAATAVLALFAGAACRVHDTTVPPTSGPSEFAQSVKVTAIPDSISMDGASQSAVVAAVYDASGQPKAGVTLRVAMAIGGVFADYGQLASRTMVTGGDGKASTIYTAPGPPAGGGAGSLVSIIVTPVGADFQASTSQFVDIRLVPPGVIVPTTGPPVAKFVLSPDPPFAFSPVAFDASSSCGSTNSSGACDGLAKITGYAWTFTDGTTATGATPVHTFLAQQAYTVGLTVTNDRGVSASTTKQLTMGVGSPPSAAFTFSPNAPGVNDVVNFVGAQSLAGSGHRIVTYEWVFGDGATGNGITVSHAYTIQGSYEVVLRVTDEVGQSAATQLPVSVALSTPAPTANFTFSPAAPVIGDSVVFDARTSITAQGQSLTDYAWNFGDGTAVTHLSTAVTSHVYASAATFTVNLVVTDTAGRNGSKQAPVIVTLGNPFASLVLFKNGGNTITADASGSFAASSSTIVSYRFIWGDGTADTVGTASSVQHTYAGAGAHTVTLVVTDDHTPTARTASVQKDITTP